MEIILTVKSVDLLKSFLQKLKLIDNSVILELTPTKFKAKTHYLKTIVKYADLDRDELFTTTAPIPARIKIGIVDLNRLINILKHFKTETVNLSIIYSEIKGDLTATHMSFYNDSLKFNLDCANLNLFEYITDEIWENVVLNRSKEIFKFPINKAELNNLISLSNLTDTIETINIVSENNQIVIGDGDFSVIVTKATNPLGKITIKKDKLPRIDKEDSMAVVTGETLVIYSNESNTIVVISNPE